MAGERTNRTAKEEVASLTQVGCRLVVVEGRDVGAEVDLVDGELTIGTDAGCGFRLTDAFVSSSHLKVAVTPGGISVSDLGSTNGTFYLGTRIREAIVTHGAVLRVGRTRVAVRSRAPAASEAYSSQHSYGSLIGKSPAMRRLYAVLERLEQVDYTVLVQGETGAGKEMVAREIHAHSSRHRKPCEVIDCTALPLQLAESELFGHVRGAFTGAVGSHEGVFARANGGTVFLDEIGDLPRELQPKLLRVLEGREFRAVGGSQSQEVDVRVIAATNKPLADEVQAGRFREDLFYRLNVVTVHVPPLRERREDIPELVRKFFADTGRSDLTLSADTLELFTCGYDWPGNVRELRNAIVAFLSVGTLPAQLATPPPRQKPTAVHMNPEEPFLQAKKRIGDALARDYLRTQLERSGNNMAQAARLAGVDRSYFRRLLQRHGLLDDHKDDDGS